MAELERMLATLGDELDWPETPELAPAVRARLRPTPRRLPALRFRRALVLAALALLLLAGTALAALPGVRDSVLEFLGLQGATVERRSTLPLGPPRRPLDLGERTTLAGARARLAFEPLVPAALEAPDRVYIRRDPPGGELSLAYGARRGLPAAGTTRLGLLVSEFRGDLVPEYLGKVAGQDTTVEQLRIDGDRAIWIEGAPHFFFYRSPRGDYEHTLRLAQNVLLLERGALLVRLEGAFGRDRALEIARSLR
jgi:hypothetical protein